ncbi:MAG TPA: nucleotidyltransferase domain-containing protein [Chitinophagaceae bacterium]|nr:nucleotidyltransferase domain-containing protein [Chitinophagaceae bacterium]
MIQHDFANKAADIVKNDPDVIGLAVAGSWIENELDEFSDLDLVLVTRKKIGGDKNAMLEYAKAFGNFISGFTGEHVGEPKLLVCLYGDPLLHVDIKFVTLKEFETRVEDPVILFERNNQLSEVIRDTDAEWPEPDFQWIEDRIWIWVHYIAGKIGRGEYFEALSNLDYIRMNVLAPLMQVKNRKKARGLRKVENRLTASDLENLKITVAQYTKASLLKALDNAISVYRSLRRKLFTADIKLQDKTEKICVDYFRQIMKGNSK